MEGLLSTGPTPSSLLKVSTFQTFYRKSKIETSDRLFQYSHYCLKSLRLSALQGASSPAVKHEFNKLGFNTLGFNDLIFTTLAFNDPWIQQPLDSTTKNSTTLTFNDPWLQQPLNSTNLGFTNIGFNYPWIQQS